MTLKELRGAMLSQVAGDIPNRDTNAEVLALIDRRLMAGEDPDVDLGDVVSFTHDDGRVSKVQCFQSSGNLAKDAAAIAFAEFLRWKRAQAPPAPVVAVPRFLILRLGLPFASVLHDPRRLLLSDDWPEGEYDVVAFCVCDANCGSSAVVGRMTSYGEGVGVLRLKNGHVWSTEMPL
jgi:hypothetical protein